MYGGVSHALKQLDRDRDGPLLWTLEEAVDSGRNHAYGIASLRLNLENWILGKR
jgi:hypothetical protein